MKEKMLTVFTPTYNRAYILDKLYESLKQQTSSDFCWLIVDDGSTDSTKQLVQKWIDEKYINIFYYYQENAGKMAAHNRGVELTKTELFLCVDSDDYLVPNAVEDLILQWKEYSDDLTIGIISKKGGAPTEQLGKGKFPDCKICKMSDFMGKTFVGDTTLCFATAKLREFKFPIIDGEKFITEDYIYDQIDRRYNYIIYDKILTICEYLEDGYTRNMDLISFRNPVGRMYHEAQNLSYAENIKDKVKASIRYNIYKNISKHSDIRKFTVSERMLLIMSIVPGYVLYRRRKKRIKRNEDSPK